MKGQFWSTFLFPHEISRRDLWLTLIPALLWLGAVYARPYVIKPRCIADPAFCNPDSVFELDRPGLGLENTPADQYSDVTQQLAGYVGAGVPVALNFGLAAIGRITPAVALAQTGMDLAIWAQTVSWNGAINETTRLLVQRPRPYVYSRPAEGNNFANYTSFYSGHTSFSAASSVALVMIMLARGAPLLLTLGSILTAHLLIFSTGLFRVLAGRHFLSDVIVGAIAGTLIALAVSWYHRRPSCPNFHSLREPSEI